MQYFLNVVLYDIIYLSNEKGFSHMRCPVCNNMMIVVERYDVELDYCINCHGIWFDFEELKFLSDAMEDVEFEIPSEENIKEVKNSKEKIHRCPRCMSKMKKIMINGNPPVIDCCPNRHGFWFDSGELGEYIQSNSKIEPKGMIKFLGEVIKMK